VDRAKDSADGGGSGEREEAMMALGVGEWIKLLSGDYAPSEEHVVYVAKFRRALRIRKDVWGNLGLPGIDVRPGSEVELVAADDGGPKLTVPDWAIDQLSLGTANWVCITERDGRLYLKRLDLVECPTRIPGRVVLDTFEDCVVTRTYSSCSDLESIRLEGLGQWLARMGRLPHDPLAPFEQMDGWLGLVARKMLVGGFSDRDLEAARIYRQEIADAQQADGSWEGGVLRTAANLIRLLDLDATIQEPAVEKAARWLLDLPEPAGLPGLFMLSEKLVRRFNEWKTKPGAKGRPHRRESKGEMGEFLSTVDYATNYALDACELRLTWTTALVLEALLRCGLHDEPRVVRAINTLFALSGHGGWCGCGYLDAKVDVPSVQEPVDWGFPVPKQNSPHHIDWFPEERDIVQPVYDGHHQALAIAPRKALLVKSWHNTGLCTMVMHRALSYHPQYAGSTLEVMDALCLAYVQSAYGTWGDMVHVSSMLGFLSRLTHPLAAFLVLRSVPWLIREQGEDGLWQEKAITRDGKGCPPPVKEESSFLILRALKQFGFLDVLWPA
jgi:hypothetical protein